MELLGRTERRDRRRAPATLSQAQPTTKGGPARDEIGLLIRRQGPIHPVEQSGETTKEDDADPGQPSRPGASDGIGPSEIGIALAERHRCNYAPAVTYEVHTPVFEGPFDLLLHLILREQVDLYEVPLARIVDAYLVELDKMAGVDLATATEFLLIAATLVELKARRLLPEDDDVDLDDELSLWEERDLLLARLLECKTFKDAAAIMDRALEDAARSLPRTAGPDERFADLQPDFLAGVDPDALRAAYLRAVTPKPVPRVDLEHLPSVRVSVFDAISEVADEVRRAGTMSFRTLCAGLGDRLEVVVRFLAVLELYKQGFVELDQPSSMAALELQWVGESDLPMADLLTADAYDG